MKRLKKLAIRLSDAFIDVTSTKRWRPVFLRLQRKIGITPVGFIGIALAVLLWMFGYLVAGKTLYLFAYGAILLIVVTYFTGKRTLPLSGERSEVRARAREGEILGVDLTLHSKRRLSTIVLEEELPDRLGNSVQLPLATLHSGEDITHSYRLFCKRRGAYKIGPLVARWGDPIGLTQREMVLVPEFELLVHPNIEMVSSRPLTRQFEDPPIRPPVSKPWPSGLEFYGMREYSPGDDLRRVVWRAFARTGKLMVREAEQGITDKITIILDTDRSHHTKDDPSESFEAGVRAAASLGYKHLTEGYTVTLHTNEDQVTRPLRGPQAPIELLDATARIEAGKQPLSESIRRLLNSTKRDAHNILITPRLRAQDAAQLQFLVRKGLSVLVVALIWDAEAEITLNTAAALGCQVVELRPGQSIAGALHNEVGAGGRTR
ncbi:MAG TPA: DUF58 domain-containing protein [Actinomycetota bacterium]|nr:DUF58 domain-containing protein [Actinomycetota bacterium]